MRKDSGFTLTELMIAIAIISILTAFAVPKILGWLPEYRLKRASRELYNNFNLARANAISKNREYVIFFDTANGIYQFVDSGDNRVFDGTPIPQNDDTVEKTVRLIDYDGAIRFGHGPADTNATQVGGAFPGEDVSYVNKQLVFNSRGLVNNTGYVYLSNVQNGGNPAGGITGGCFAVGTPVLSGIARIQKWYEPSHNWAFH